MRIGVMTLYGVKAQEVPEEDVYGDYCCHPSVGESFSGVDSSFYTVSHIPSGLCITRNIVEKSEAEGIAKILGEKFSGLKMIDLLDDQRNIRKAMKDFPGWGGTYG